ncbi:Uncharacterized membrane protein YhaH, DUF805 family [Acinetobacter apis]|uniref:Uncharacterized membrane protein YhaH, DUF805 family n=2 Tax=Acinetobacter apis TaxID=1229165 RepID=A0A217EHR7_9GAMM|nr:Uncharacterized membrane protein YhaH, DUF805 family [Acinetobacter apis]
MMNIFNQFRIQHQGIMSTQGRIGRFTYCAWTFVILLLVSIFWIGILKCMEHGLIQREYLVNMQLTLMVITLIFVQGFQMIISIKRLHDRNLSGWYWLFNFVPFANLWLFINLTFLPGISNENKYGPQRATTNFETIMAWLSIIIYSSIILFAVIMLSKR